MTSPSRPDLPATTHELSFDKLSPRQFERLCLWLVRREGYERAEHLGAAGSEQARDIVAWKDGKQWAFQCKRVKQFGPTKALVEVDKVLGLPKSERPVGLIFIVTRDVSAATRKKARERCARQIECHFWAGTELDEMVKRQPDIIEEFFRLPFASPSPHQLPPDIADFTGRRKELGKVTRLLVRAAQARGTAVVISAVAGMPGVGKSALAIHAALALKKYFPDATLYVNLRGADDQPVPPTEALAGFLRALGFDDPNMPKDLQGRSALYRSLLDGKRALVLLDNAHDEAQVRPLLPGSPTCAVLVTSRALLSALEGAEALNLEVMPETEALSLLRKLAGARRIKAEPKAARRIVKLCGYLPLAIRIAGGKLRGKPHWTLAAYASRLSDQRGRLQRLKLGDLEVRASFAISYRDLAPADARLFRLLGLLVGPDFASDVASALVEVYPEAAEEGLEHLVDAQLLEAAGGGRYKFHDLMRLFARERLEEEESAGEQHAARLRCASFYLAVSHIMNGWLKPEVRRQQAQPMVSETGQSLEETERSLLLGALAWYDRERTILLAVVEWAYECEEWELVGELVESLARFFNIRSHWVDWERTHRLALKATRRAGDRSGESATLGNLGLVYTNEGRWGEAIDTYETSLGILRELGDRLAEGQTLNNLGLVYSNQGRWDEAIGVLTTSLAISREMGDRHGEGGTLSNLGEVYYKQGRWDETIETLKTSLGIFRELGGRHMEGKALNNLGLVYTDQRRWAEASEMLEASLAINREMEDRHGEGKTLMGLGEVYRRQGRWDEAIDMFGTSLAISREMGDRHGERTALNNLGIVYAQQGRWDEAIGLFQTSLRIKRKLEDRHGDHHTLANLGGVYRRQGRWDEAIEMYEASLAICREMGDRRGEGQTLVNLGDVYASQGHWDRAIEMFDASLVISRELEDRHGEGQTLMKLGAAFASAGRRDEAIDTFQASLAIRRELGDRQGESMTLHNLGFVYAAQGRCDEAIEVHEASLVICRELGDRHGEGQTLAGLGLIHFEHEQVARALALWREALGKLHPDSPEYPEVAGWLEEHRD